MVSPNGSELLYDTSSNPDLPSLLLNSFGLLLMDWERVLTTGLSS